MGRVLVPIKTCNYELFYEFDKSKRYSKRHRDIYKTDFGNPMNTTVLYSNVQISDFNTSIVMVWGLRIR